MEELLKSYGESLGKGYQYIQNALTSVANTVREAYREASNTTPAKVIKSEKDMLNAAKDKVVDGYHKSVETPKNAFNNTVGKPVDYLANNLRTAQHKAFDSLHKLFELEHKVYSQTVGKALHNTFHNKLFDTEKELLQSGKKQAQETLKPVTTPVVEGFKKGAKSVQH